LRRWRSWILLLALVGTWAWLEWRKLPSDADPEQVDERFTLCGRGGATACVVDGDSFRIGARKVRIKGIDAPEMHGSCPGERALAVKSRDRLLALLNQGPFTMGANRSDARDQYGRDLRVLERVVDGRRQSIGGQLVREGLAHDYVNHKTSWCVESAQS
jgi:micrococcal nuclease